MISNKSKYRIVIDTNVIISAIVFGGKPRQVLELLSHDRVTVAVAEEILTELRRKIDLKFPEFLEDLAAVEELLKRDGVMVKLGAIHERFSRDPDDDKFVESAILGDCQFIVTGDKDLLALGSYQQVTIVTPSEFLTKEIE